MGSSIDVAVSGGTRTIFTCFTAWFLRVASFLCLILFLSTFLCGCRTYYGYTETRSTKSTLSGQKEENIRHFARLDFDDDSVRLFCFRKYDLRSRYLVKRMAVAEDYYRDFDGDYYLDTLSMNPLKNYDPILAKAYGKSILKEKFNGNPLYYLVPGAGQAALAVDMMFFCVSGSLDLLMITVGSCYSMIAWPTKWLGGRFFGWMGEWELKPNKPDAFTMLSYMPFINLFFPFQTPPYMTDGPSYSRERELGVVSSHTEISIEQRQAAHTSFMVQVEVVSGGKTLAQEKIFSSNGWVQLNNFLQNAVKKAPDTAESVTLNISILGSDNKTVVFRRKCELDLKQIIPLAARQDMASCNSADVDCLNKVLLRRRSHRMWREELLGDDFKNLQERFKTFRRRK